ncbi:MAG: alanine dehydrogenase [Actinobacteria bacterium]|nr:alanine dehydrogenase [Actinomycetota bacterium]
MIIGIPKEIKNNEFRVSATASGVHAYVTAGHTVLVEKNAGQGSAISDADYIAAGAQIIDSADEIWQKADLIQKVKEPIEIEYKRMRKGQILYTYLHLAANKACTQAVMESGITAIAYETVEVDGQLPLLAPMSEVGVPGVRAGKVVVIGGGVVGVAAATIAHGMRADVTIMDLDLKRLGQIDQIFGGNVKTLASSSYEIEKEVTQADLVIGAVLVHGAKAPKLVSNALVSRMKPGSVLVDVAIDQGGCFEDSKATTHQDPTYKVHDSIFYCVANMPGAVPATSTYALANATIKYGLALANKGWQRALADDAHLAKGLNVHEGKIYYEAVAKAHNL